MAPSWRFLKHRNVAHRDAGGGAVHSIKSGSRRALMALLLYEQLKA
jgi:hypothetical protein